jgi:hypothetical protein
MKRTTIVLDPSLFAELKKRAAAEGRTFTDVVEHALRSGLAARPPQRRPRVAPPSYDLGPFLISPADRAAALEAVLHPATRVEEP